MRLPLVPRHTSTTRPRLLSSPITTTTSSSIFSLTPDWCTNTHPLTIPPLALPATSVGARSVSTLRVPPRGRQITIPRRLGLPPSGSLSRLFNSSTARPGPRPRPISSSSALTGCSLLGLARLTLPPRARAPLGYGYTVRFMPSSNHTANYHSQSRPRSPLAPSSSSSSRPLASRLDPRPSPSAHFASTSRAFKSAASAIRPSSSSGPSGSADPRHEARSSLSSSAPSAQPRKRPFPELTSHDSDLPNHGSDTHQHKKMRRHPRRPAKNGRGGGGKPPPPPLQQLEPPLLNREEILRRFPTTLKQQWEENPKAPLANYLGGGSGGAQNLGEGGKGFVVTEGSVNGQKVFR